MILNTSVYISIYRSKSSTICKEVMGRLSGRKLIIELNTFMGLVADPLAVPGTPAPIAAAAADAFAG